MDDLAATTNITIAVEVCVEGTLNRVASVGGGIAQAVSGAAVLILIGIAECAGFAVGLLTDGIANCTSGCTTDCARNSADGRADWPTNRTNRCAGGCAS